MERYEEAKTLLKKEEYSKASEILTLLAKQFNQAPILNDLGYSLQKQGKLDDAISYYVDALLQNQSFAEAHFNLGYCYQLQGKYDLAKKHFLKAREYDATHCQAIYFLAMLCHKRSTTESTNPIEEAIKFYDECLLLDPKNSYAQCNAGIASVIKSENVAVVSKDDSLRWREKAIKHFQSAVEQDKKMTDARFNLALLLQQSGKMEEAIEQLLELLKHEPGSIDALFTLGVFYQESDAEQSLQYYQRTLQYDSDHSAAHNNIGELLRKKGEVFPSIEHYKKAIQCNNQSNLYHDNLGLAFLQTNQFLQAIVEFKKALSLISNDSRSLIRTKLHLAQAMHAQGDSTAIGTVEELLKQYPGDEEILNLLKELKE